ncbi:MAG: YeeE/YedE family protein [bacterium]|nr:YeeE/YedE family protein [bacterium]
MTAVPIGFLFGFSLRKGDLCGASAFSEVILMKDGRKVWGLWVAIVTGMAGFAVLDALGLVQLNPKPLLWASLLVGGVLFGAGMVLAGGCVSGTLYKAGSGHMNSLVALLGIPIGIALVEYGPLSPLHSHLKTMNAGRITFSSITGLPFWTLAALLAAGTLAVALRRRRSRFWLTRSWRPWQAGLLIGVLGSAAYLSSAASGRNYPLGVTHGVLHAQVVATDQNVNFVYQPPSPAAQQPEGRKVSVWLIALVVSLVAGSWFASRLAGAVRLIAKPPEQLVVAFLGSLLVGAGAALAGGCVIGNILSGIALMSVGGLFFAAVVVLSNWATMYVYLRGADS